MVVGVPPGDRHRQGASTTDGSGPTVDRDELRRGRLAGGAARRRAWPPSTSSADRRPRRRWWPRWPRSRCGSWRRPPQARRVADEADLRLLEALRRRATRQRLSQADSGLARALGASSGKVTFRFAARLGHADDRQVGVRLDAGGGVGARRSRRPRRAAVGRRAAVRRGTPAGVCTPTRPVGAPAAVAVDQAAARHAPGSRRRARARRGPPRLEQRRVGQRTGGVVDRDHVELAALDVRARAPQGRATPRRAGSPRRRPPRPPVVGAGAADRFAHGVLVARSRTTTTTRSTSPASEAVRTDRPGPGSPPQGQQHLVDPAPTRVPDPAASSTTAARGAGGSAVMGRACQRSARPDVFTAVTTTTRSQNLRSVGSGQPMRAVR